MAGGFGGPTDGEEFEAKITPIVVISCILAASGGLMFGYDIGISGTYIRDCLATDLIHTHYIFI